MIVSNSTPIINFGKQGMLEILKKCFDKIFIPTGVYGEIMEKMESVEAISLKKAIGEGWIVVSNITVMPLLETKLLGKGEKEAISLAVKHKSVLLIDDDIPKAYASLFGVEAHGTFYAIYLACKKKFISKKEAQEIFKGMIKEGFYVSTQLYSRFFELLDSVK